VAFPQLVTSSSGAPTASGTSHSATLPASISAGNLIVVVAGIDDADNNDTLTLNDGTYDLLLDSVDAGVGRACLTVALKVADGSESGDPLSFSSTNSEQFTYVCLNLSGASGEAEASAAASNAFNAAPNPASLTPAGWEVEDTLGLALCIVDPAWTTIDAGPSGYSNFLENHQADSGNDGVGVGVATLESAAASEDPGAFTLSNAGSWTAYTVALRPGGAAPPPQELRPDADIVTTGWTSTPLHSKLADDSDATVVTATLA
jgi:hypothetical protein